MIKITLFDGTTISYKSFVFSGGEVSVKISDTSAIVDSKSIHLFASIKNSNDLMELLMITDAIRIIKPEILISVTIPYLPYARQDRVMVDGESLSIKVFANIINSQNYINVYVWDAHSEVGVALIDRCVNTPQYVMFNILGYNADPANTILVSPDAGAEKKIYGFAKATGIADIMFASKVRDVNNGKILQTVINNIPGGAGLHQPETRKDFLIADDICDGGGTFIALAEKLRPLTTGKIKLLVTHGIFSKGIEVFDGIIDEVIVLNNINDVKSTVKTKVIS